MRGLKNSNSFLQSVERISSLWIQTRSSALRSKVTDNSNYHGGKYFFKVQFIDYRRFVQLAILSWYMDDEVRFVLQEDLREKLKTFDFDDRVALQLLLASKAECLIFLAETSLWHTRDFFGNIFRLDNNLDNCLQPTKPSLKLNKPQRKRGYSDKGSRVEPHRWKPKEGYQLTELQEEIEAKRASQSDTLDFLRGFLS